jgi:hypothetical protein
MSVKFEYIDDFLRNVGLQNPNLKVLVDDAGLYKTVAYQHLGEVDASVDGEMYIRNKNRDLAISKFDSFFNIALENKVELAITPEYSCPWENINTLLETKKLPEPGNVWVIGCESIMPREFKQFVQKYDNDSVTMIYEVEAHESEEKKFLDPIIYIFKTKVMGGDTYRDVLVFQFKSHPMGAAFKYEADNMLRGSKRYIIRNGISSIWLITIICSESLAFDEKQDELNFSNQPYLILHLQLNTNPRTTNFIKYRTTLYNEKKDPVKDLICLNWAKGSDLSGNVITSSNSSIFIKSNAVTDKIEETKICSNDKLGLYYHYWKDARTGLFLFNYSESIFLFENFKASQRSEVAQLDRARRGPKMLKKWVWNEINWCEHERVTNSEFEDSCEEMGGNFDFLLDGKLSSINLERLLSLSTGGIDSSAWTHPTENSLFKTSNDEKSNRIALFQDPETKNNKERLLSQFSSLVHQFQDPNNIPNESQMTDLKDGCKFRYQESKLSYNVVGDKNIPACLVWAGDMPPRRARQLKDDIIKSIKDEDTNKTKRILIWYNHQGLKEEFDPSAPKNNENPNQSPTSFKKTVE